MKKSILILIILLASIFVGSDYESSIIEEAQNAAIKDYPSNKVIIGACVTAGCSHIYLWNLDKRPVPAEYLVGRTPYEIEIFTQAYRKKRKENLTGGNIVGSFLFFLLAGLLLGFQIETGACAIEI